MGLLWDNYSQFTINTL